MTFTRDSGALWLGAAVALVGYLSLSEKPTTWDYYAWLKFAAVVLAWVSGKLANSPLGLSPGGQAAKRVADAAKVVEKKADVAADKIEAAEVVAADKVEVDAVKADAHVKRKKR